MKNLQKGFVIPLVIAIIAVLAIGGGIYYSKNKSETAINTVSNSPIPSGQTYNKISDWKTYRNDKGFEIKYPSDGWSVKMPGAGEEREATSQAEIFSITKNDDTDGISFDIAALGSDRLGSYYASAKDLSQYLNLLAKTDQNGNTIRKFVKMVNVAGQQAYWYQTYEWFAVKQANDWSSQVYWQHGNDIYEIEVQIDPTTSKVSNQILSTFKFTR